MAFFSPTNHYIEKVPNIKHKLVAVQLPLQMNKQRVFVQNSYIKNEERVQTVHRDAYNQLNNNHGEQFKMDIKKMTKTHNYFLHNKLKSTDRYLKG